MLRIVIVVAALGIAMVPGLAQAQQMPCAERDLILSKLGQDYAEQPVSLGLSSTGTLVEILASEGGSWTLIYTRPDGPSCVIATGESWKNITQQPELPATISEQRQDSYGSFNG